MDELSRNTLIIFRKDGKGVRVGERVSERARGERDRGKERD